MILRTLLLICSLLVTSSFGKMSLKDFSMKMEDMCFQNEESDPFRINGQENPLSNTLENFISLAEKFEAANPTAILRDELTYFIQNYIFENIKFTDGQVDEWKVGGATLTEVENLWDPNKIGGSHLSQFEEPFTDSEKCNLYYMISHSIVQKDLMVPRFYSYRNDSSSRDMRNSLNPDDYYPQEIGVVAIRGTDAAVSLSKVLIGLYVGLDENRKKDLTSFNSINDALTPEDDLPQDRTVDSLYVVTMADVLMLSNWTLSDRKGLAPNGKWVSIPLGKDGTIDGFCPMVYKQQNQGRLPNGELPAYSYSSVRGAADGLILGSIIRPIYNKRDKIKLSQILRMYYSRDGIAVEQGTEDVNKNRVSFCDRQMIVDELERKLHDQMLFYGYLVSEKGKKNIDKILNAAVNLYAKEKRDIYENSNTELQNYCSKSLTLEKPEDLPRETFLDIIVVMDSSISEDSFQKQQLIVGYLAKDLDLRYTGSRMTILLDHRIDSGSSSSGKVELKPVVTDTYSSSCAACIVAQAAYENSKIERDIVITGVDQLLQERKENETKLNGVNGKVVVYFDFEPDEMPRDNKKIQGRLERALMQFHQRHQDVLFYAVGLNTEMLKKYARNNPTLVFLAGDGTEEEVANKIFDKISAAPSLLQYADCEEGRSESSAVYENFVSPMAIQHWEMPAKYFYKSRNLKVMFESQNGHIRVCHNRATMKPENEVKFCKNTTIANRIEFKISNPCKSFTKETCSPFFFAIIGINGDNRERRDYCIDSNDHWCSTLEQMKFRVSHEGIRCSGCLGLGASYVAVLMTILFIYVFQKRF